MREAKRQGARVILLTSRSLENVEWPKESRIQRSVRDAPREQLGDPREVPDTQQRIIGVLIYIERHLDQPLAPQNTTQGSQFEVL
jgi:hypothetical protein